MSKLKDAKMGTNITTRITATTTEETKNDKVPEGAEIVSKTVTTSTEKIENGWLIIKSYDIQYKAKGKEHRDYAYFSKKWYSKNDPLDIKIKQQALADAFEEE